MADLSPFLILVVVVAFIGFLIALFVAPIKLYGIHRELVKLNAETHIQTRLLASLAKDGGETGEDPNAAEAPAYQDDWWLDPNTQEWHPPDRRPEGGIQS